MRRPTSTFFALLLLSACSSPAPTLPPAAPPATTPAAANTQADAALRQAISEAESGRAPGAGSWQQHPASVWVEYAQLRHALEHKQLATGQAEAFLARHGDTPAGQRLRQAWLQALGQQRDFATFLRHWRDADSRSPALQCWQWQARAGHDPAWPSPLQSLWLASAKALPASCRPLIQQWQAQGGLTPALVWQRITLALDAGAPAVVRESAHYLPAGDAALAHAHAAALEGTLPDAALHWPPTAASRAAARQGLRALAKHAPHTAWQRLPAFAEALRFESSDRNAVLYEIALQSAASYLPEAAGHLAAVPASAYDERLHQLAVREALARRDNAAALAAIGRMPPALRQKTQWQYFEARLLEALRRPGAEALYRQAAQKADFYGFLAADRLQLPYALCPRELSGDAATGTRVASLPRLQSALALYRIGRKSWAVDDWKAALEGLDDEARFAAIALAQTSGWYERAVFDLDSKNPEELRLYSLRFPLAYQDAIADAARESAIDPAWIAAEIRAESLFQHDARSPANALGLMQVLPSTGQAVAARIGLDWQGEATLYTPASNIRLGSAYLRQMLERWQALPQAIAAYNAGPTPVARWQAQRGDMGADFWIETISYRETREYVPRILAFSVFYDWRMNGKVQRVSDRMAGRRGTPVAVHCPAASAPAPLPTPR